MGAFYAPPRERGIIEACMSRGILATDAPYGISRMDFVSSDSDAFAFVSAVLINALESRWYSAFAVNSSAFARRLLYALECSTSLAGLFFHNDALCRYDGTALCPANVSKAAVAVVGSVLTLENYPDLRDLARRVRSFGAPHTSIVTVFADDDISYDDDDVIVYPVLTGQDIKDYCMATTASS